MNWSLQINLDQQHRTFHWWFCERLSFKTALIDDSVDLANAPPKRKMGRQMASHGFRQALNMRRW